MQIIIWARWNGTFKEGAIWTMRDGTKIDLSGKKFADLAYAYRLTFDKTTKKVTEFHGLVDFGDLARLADAPALAGALVASPFYPLVGK
jgi:hypothetical protein